MYCLVSVFSWSLIKGSVIFKYRIIFQLLKKEAVTPLSSLSYIGLLTFHFFKLVLFMNLRKKSSEKNMWTVKDQIIPVRNFRAA
jgi:hypothetical protein